MGRGSHAKHRKSVKQSPQQFSGGGSSPPVADPATAWVDSVDVSAPDALGFSNLLRAYALHAACTASETRHTKGNCSDNPRCLATLRKVKANATSINKFIRSVVGSPPDVPAAATAAGNGDDGEAVPRRGIRNLGNTCYMNSILQLLFYLPPVRRAVLSECAVAGSPVATSGLGDLFAQLALSCAPRADSEIFCKAMAIDPKVQQDAQEFLNLLLAWIEERAAKAETREALKAELGGNLVRAKTCQHCGAVSRKWEACSFFSVSVKAKLVDGIAQLLAPEQIEGFACEQCGRKGTATGTTQIKTLPRTLIFHFIRFTYDVARGDRRKEGDNVSFPTTLDMSPFYGGAAGDAAPPKYTLEGVVNHLGESAWHGHYTFHGRAPGGASDDWFSYDDAKVTKLRRYGGENTASKEAYLVVYRRAGVEDARALPSAEEFPAALLERVRAFNQELAVSAETYARRRADTEKEVAEWSALADTVFSAESGPIVAGEKPLYFLPRSWLRSFGRVFSESVGSGEDDDEEENANDGAKGGGSKKKNKTEPGASKTVAVNVDGEDESTPKAAAAAADGADSTAADDGGARSERDENENDDSGAAAAAASSSSPPRAADDDDEDDDDDDEAAAAAGANQADDYGAGPLSYAQAMPRLLCAHGKLRIGAPFKAVSEAAFLAVHERYGGGAAPLSTDNALCALCAAAHIAELQEQRSASSVERRMRDLSRVQDATAGVLVSAEFLQWWQGPLLGARNATGRGKVDADDVKAAVASINDVDPTTRDVTEGLLCEHGTLSPSAAPRCIAPEVFEYLVGVRGYQSRARLPFGTDKCALCTRAAQEDASARHGMKMRKLAEAKELKTLVSVSGSDINKAVWARALGKYVSQHRKNWERELLAAAEKGGAEAVKPAAAAPPPPTTLTFKKNSAGSASAAAEPAAAAAAAPNEDESAPAVAAGPPQRRFEWFCVPTEWADAWRKWQRDATNFDVAPPGAPDNRPFLCAPHGGAALLVTDLRATEHEAAGTRAPLTILSAEEYAFVVATYGEPLGGAIRFVELDNTRVLEPATCDECVMAAKAAEHQKRAFFECGGVTVDAQVRRSKNKYTTTTLVVNGLHHTMQVRELIERVSTLLLEQERLLVPHDKVQLYCTRRRAKLEDADATLHGAEVLAGDAFKLNVDDICAIVDSAVGSSAAKADDGTKKWVDAVASSPAGGPTTRGKAKGRSEGIAFHQSRLMGGHVDPNDAAVPAAAAAPSGAAAPGGVVECPACTFHNAPSARSCEMCESPLP